MLGVLAIVAVIAAGRTYSLEFTEEKFQELYKIELPTKPLKAEFINAHKPLQRQKPRNDKQGGTLFYLAEASSRTNVGLQPRMKRYFCGEHNGIYLHFPYKIPDEDLACKIWYFRWVAQRLETGHSKFTYFTVLFEYGYYGPLVLVIPIFETPAQGTSEDIRQWAESNQVGLLDPSLQKQFENALRGNPILLENFDWLSNLLSYGVFKYQRQLSLGGVKIKSYVTRPVVLPQDAIELLIQRVDHIGVGDNPTNAGSSSSHQSDDNMSDLYQLDAFKLDQGEFSDVMFDDPMYSYEEAIRDEARLRESIYSKDHEKYGVPTRKYSSKHKSRK